MYRLGDNQGLDAVNATIETPGFRAVGVEVADFGSPKKTPDRLLECLPVHRTGATKRQRDALGLDSPGQRCTN